MKQWLRRFLVVGPGGCGKDTFAKMFAMHSGLIYAGSMSEVIAEQFAKENGTTKEYEMAHRHDDRPKWFTKGNVMREADPCALLRAGFAKGDILTGARNKREIIDGNLYGLYDLAFWVHREGVELDPTLEFGFEDLPVSVRMEVFNTGDLDYLDGQAKQYADAVTPFLSQFARA